MAAVVLQGLGLVLVVVFGATFGARWGILAAALVLLFLGIALSDSKPAAPAAPAVPGDGEEVLWTS